MSEAFEKGIADRCIGVEGVSIVDVDADGNAPTALCFGADVFEDTWVVMTSVKLQFVFLEEIENYGVVPDAASVGLTV